MAEGARTRRRSGSEVKVSPVYPPMGAGIEVRPPRGKPECLVSGTRIHMVGVGGCGMRGAAAVLLRQGMKVSGSDKSASAELTQLSKGFRLTSASPRATCRTPVTSWCARPRSRIPTPSWSRPNDEGIR